MLHHPGFMSSEMITSRCYRDCLRLRQATSHSPYSVDTLQHMCTAESGDRCVWSAVVAAVLPP